jgi:hypothetical protein
MNWRTTGPVTLAVAALGCGGLASGGSGDAGGSDASSGGICADASATPIYAISQGNTLYRYDPSGHSFSVVGHVDCSRIRCVGGADPPMSIAVDVHGTGYLATTCGTLYAVDLSSTTCQATTFNLAGNLAWFAFAGGVSGAAPETLFYSEGQLHTLDTTTFVSTGIGGVLPGGFRLTGTGDGRLFGITPAQHGNGIVVAQLDPTTGSFLNSDVVPSIDGLALPFPFAFWGGHFYLFASPSFASPSTGAKRTAVYDYDPTSKSLSPAGMVADTIYAVGVSPCAPLR